MANNFALGLGALATGVFKGLSEREDLKRSEKLAEKKRNQEIEDNLDKRLYEMVGEGNPRAASYLDKKYGLALGADQPGFGALARPYVSLGELDRSKMPTDTRLSNLKQGEDFRNFEQRVAPQAQERSSSAFVGPFQVGAEMAKRKAEEAQAAKRDYQAEIERRSIDDAYKGIDELALKGGVAPEEYKKVLAGRQAWLKTGDKEKIYMPENLSKIESALEIKRMDRADTIRNQALNNLTRSFDVNTAELAKLDQAAEQVYDNWDKQQKTLEELNTEPGRIEVLKEKLLYRRLKDIDKRRNDIKKRQEGLLEREAELLGSDAGKMAGKPTEEPAPEVKLQERAEDFQTSVYNTYLSGLQQQFEELAKRNRPNLEGVYDSNFGYDPIENDDAELRDFVQGTLGLENYDVRKPQAIYQAMKQKALEKMQGDFAQAYPELAPKEQKADLRGLIAAFLQRNGKASDEATVEAFLKKYPDVKAEELE